MLKPNGAAGPILRVNALVIGAAFLLQRALIIANGATHAAATLYVWALGGLLGAIMLALMLLKLGHPAIAMHTYAVSGMIAVAAMTHGHMTSGGQTFPLLLLLVPLGLVCVSLALGWRVGRYYACAAAALLIGLAVIYGRPSDAVMALALLTLSVVSAQEVGKVALEAQNANERAEKLERDFNNLSVAVEAFTGNGESKAGIGQERGGADRGAA